MDELKREKISITNALYEVAQAIISKKDMTKEEYIKETMCLYLKEKKRMERIEKLKQGYLEMGRINLEICECGFEQDINDLKAYELYVGEIV